MRAVILDKDTFGRDDVSWQRIEQQCSDVRCFSHTDASQLAARLADAEAVFVNKVVLDKKALIHAKQLKYIGVLATGTNNIDLKAAASLGITVNNVEGYGTDSVAQHTMMLMLALAGKLTAYQHAIQTGEWSASDSFCLLHLPITEVAGKHLVIVGFGTLGQRVKALAEAFGMRVSVAARPHQDYTEGAAQIARKPLDSLLPSADFLSLHCLLSEETEKLINQVRLRLMKPSACIINTARGGLIDEQALADALTQGTIAGAGLDVLSEEPPNRHHPLIRLQHPNLILTPHNAWASKEARQRLLDLAADHFCAFLRSDKSAR
ncbi:D-2-hydroxyacid dehydrogenase [Aestuariibacter sp. AA17]|uniref:D-2-hydroxyacid dehydrogenase n=1 Tax=Fluctibacter corallii TaxID=2984329 RepID=A0ABT3A9V0_9ALTE|nr:D-2-hydroxyacid dehydrogenase [Aestuariibacter sp. AA17]MCV2885091.1 D-2-hydroxyacid dehydrogenase [Aestuariibacter sp. AA17]